MGNALEAWQRRAASCLIMSSYPLWLHQCLFPRKVCPNDNFIFKKGYWGKSVCTMNKEWDEFFSRQHAQLCSPWVLLKVCFKGLWQNLNCAKMGLSDEFYLNLTCSVKSAVLLFTSGKCNEQVSTPSRCWISSGTKWGFVFSRDLDENVAIDLPEVSLQS